MNGTDRHIARNLHPVLLRRLDRLNQATDKRDLNIAGFHELKGDRKGTCAWRITANWRLTFRFENGDAYDVDFEDYH